MHARGEVEREKTSVFAFGRALQTREDTGRQPHSLYNVSYKTTVSESFHPRIVSYSRQDMIADRTDGFVLARRCHRTPIGFGGVSHGFEMGTTDVDWQTEREQDSLVSTRSPSYIMGLVV